MDGRLRIGELARRVGSTPEVLRAWERRYGLLRPERSAGGFRLYGEDDVRRVERMREGLARGLSAAEAARAVVEGEPEGEGAVPADGGALVDALVHFDGVGADAILDRQLAVFTVEAVLRDAILPALRELGDRWERREITVAQEHYASQHLRARLASLARGWDRGIGPRALLACPPRELHDLGLLAFGVALRRRGWRIAYLGADTPVETLVAAVADVGPDAVVLAAVDRRRYARVEDELRAVAREVPVALGGAGADESIAGRVGAVLLAGDAVAEADGLAETLTRRARGRRPASPAA